MWEGGRRSRFLPRLQYASASKIQSSTPNTVANVHGSCSKSAKAQHMMLIAKGTELRVAAEEQKKLTADPNRPMYSKPVAINNEHTVINTQVCILAFLESTKIS